MRSAALLALLMLTLPASAQAKRIPPRDECSASPTFGAFYRGFRSVVARRDARALIALIPAKNVEMDFGGSDRGQFVEQWHLGRGAKSELWPVLQRALSRGCARVGQDFISPAKPTTDYRAMFRKVEGKWAFTFFGAGD